MQSQLTVRLPDDLEREIARMAKDLRLKRSDIVRMALEQFVREPRVKEDQAPYGKVKNLIGAVESGVPDLGQAHRDHLVKRIRKQASPYTAAIKTQGQLTIPKKMQAIKHFKEGQIVSLIPLGDSVIITPRSNKQNKLNEARKRIERILKESGISAEEVLAGLTQEREALYQERYGRKAR